MSAKSASPAPHFAPLQLARSGSIVDVKDHQPLSCPPSAISAHAAISAQPLPAPSLPPLAAHAFAGRAWLCVPIAALCTAAAVPALAQVPSALPAADLALALALAQQTAERLAPAGAQVDATLGALDSRLKPAPCSRAEAFLPRGVPAWGVTRVGLRCTQGPVAWTLYLPVKVQVRAPALSLRSALPAGTILAETDLVSAPVDWSAGPLAPLTDAGAVLGRTLARAVAAGTALQATDLKARRWFVAGDRVKVVSGGAGFAIVADGLALGDGQDGQRVRIQMLLRGNDGQPERGPVVQGQAVAERQVALPL